MVIAKTVLSCSFLVGLLCGLGCSSIVIKQPIQLTEGATVADSFRATSSKLLQLNIVFERTVTTLDWVRNLMEAPVFLEWEVRVDEQREIHKNSLSMENVHRFAGKGWRGDETCFIALCRFWVDSFERCDVRVTVRRTTPLHDTVHAWVEVIRVE